MDVLTKNALLTFVLASLICPVTGLASGDAAAGQEKAATCEACHGKAGHSVDPSYPDLAGQYKTYLIKALTDYRSGRRTNPIMAGFASQLSNRDIEDLAAWYASLKGLRNLSDG